MLQEMWNVPLPNDHQRRSFYSFYRHLFWNDIRRLPFCVEMLQNPIPFSLVSEEQNVKFFLARVRFRRMILLYKQIGLK